MDVMIIVHKNVALILVQAVKFEMNYGPGGSTVLLKQNIALHTSVNIGFALA